MQTVGEEGEWKEIIGFRVEVELGVICVTMEIIITFTDSMARWKQIYNEEKGAQDRSLGDAGSDLKLLGFGSFDLNVL